jgi:hypothetical protein
LSHLFGDQDFSRAWESDDQQDSYVELTDDVTDVEARTINTSDPNRVFHTFDKWECVKHGFYASTKDGMTKEQCEECYRDFLSDTDRFRTAAKAMVDAWPMSCEHYLTNVSMNRIAWIGQASVCFKLGIPSCFRGGWSLLSKEQQDAADAVALEVLNEWLEARKLGALEIDEAAAIGRQVEIY